MSHDDQQLLDQRKHQARFSADGHLLGGQMRSAQFRVNRAGNDRGIVVFSLAQGDFQLLNRGGSGCFWLG